MNTVSDETELELRFEARPGNRVLVRARMPCQTFNCEFDCAAPRAELFLWLAEEIRKQDVTRLMQHERCAPTAV